MFKLLFKLFSLRLLLNNKGMANETTSTTMTEAIPTAVSAALLEFEEGDIIRPLVRTYDFSGPGLVHSTPIISKLTGETDDSLQNQAIDSGTYTGSPSNATVGVVGSTVFLKEIAAIGMVDDLMAIAGQLIGQSVVTQREIQLATLFTSITAIEGDNNEAQTPAHIFSAYLKLRNQKAPQPYFWVMHPGHMWGTGGVVTIFSNVADSSHYSGAVSGGPGSVGEDIMRNGWAGRVFGFDAFTDANVVVGASNNASGAAFYRDAFKYVPKREFRIDTLFSGPEVGWQVSGTEMFGSAILKNNMGVEMQFNMT